MPYIVISVNPLVYLISYLCTCVRTLEINNVERDGVFFYSFSINNYDKENSFFKYFSFIEDIGITFIRRDNRIHYLFELNSVRKGISTISIDTHGVVSESHKLVFKHKWRDQKISQFFHTVRIYSNGVIIHSTKLFKFIYRINSKGDICRRQL